MKKLYAIEYRFGWKFIFADSMKEALEIYGDDVFKPMSCGLMLDEDGDMELDTFEKIVETEKLRHSPIALKPSRRRVMHSRVHRRNR